MARSAGVFIRAGRGEAVVRYVVVSRRGRAYILRRGDRAVLSVFDRRGLTVLEKVTTRAGQRAGGALPVQLTAREVAELRGRGEREYGLELILLLRGGTSFTALRGIVSLGG